MRFHIKSVILWPKGDSLPPKIHPFEPGMINVVTGASKTGKSALIPLIDYCLAASRCGIPIGHIRNKCSWYGLLIELEDGELFLARKNPGLQQQTAEMIYQEGKNLTIPLTISDDTPGRTTANSVKEKLNELARMPDIPLDPLQEENYRQRPSFRDLLAFCFQPQNIIANSNSLFFRTDIAKYRDRLRAVFPFALGVLDAQTLQSKWTLESLIRVLRRKERELRDQRLAIEKWRTDAGTWLTRAVEYGLVNRPDDYRALDWSQTIGLLAIAAKKSVASSTPSQTEMGEIGQTLASLDRQESDLARLLGALRRRQSELSRLSTGHAAYSQGLHEQAERLSLSNWIKARSSSVGECPLCRSKLEHHHEKLGELITQLELTEGAIAAIEPSPPEVFLKETFQVREDITLAIEKLNKVRKLKLDLAVTNSAASDRIYQAEEVAQFIGRLQQMLLVYAASQEGSELEKEVADLRSIIDDLSKEASAGAIAGKMARVLSDVQDRAMSILPQLDSEYPNNKFRIDAEELTLRVTDEAGVERYLWEIGSGANWLAYHLATAFALQSQFVSKAFNPVPSFLVLDQPSQVYFPRAQRSVEGGAEDFSWVDEDAIAVRRVFEVLSGIASEEGNSLQVIVVDHAREEMWGDLPGISKAAEWRGSEKLVPIDWPEF